VGVLGTSGVLGTADDGLGVFGINNQNNPGTDTLQPAILANNISTIKGTLAFWAAGGIVGGSCTVDVSGNLACTGSKSAVVPVDNGNRSVALYAVEAADNWFEDFGSGKLNEGAVTISLDPRSLKP
jgi:hypothetical protein